MVGTAAILALLFVLLPLPQVFTVSIFSVGLIVVLLFAMLTEGVVAVVVSVSVASTVLPEIAKR